MSQPVFTAVMPTFGGWRVTSEALGALAQHTDVRHEVIVVDNGSADGTPDRLRAAYPGVRVIENGRNLGFGPASNQGAAVARGAHLLFLNSDAIVQEGWIEPLLDALTDPSVTAVAPIFLERSGRVQECGSLLWGDGGTSAYGEGVRTDRSTVSFRREVDYASAACLLVRRSEFNAVGGFDPVYVPAYGEDVELCLRIRARGGRILVVPASRVVHLRGASSSSAEAARLMREHRSILRSRFPRALAHRPLPEVNPPERLLIALRDAVAIHRILVTDDRVPHADRGSGDPRMLELLTALAQARPAARITLAPSDRRNGGHYAAPLERLGIEVAHDVTDWSRWFSDRAGHYSAVICSRPGSWSFFHGLVRATQGRAAIAYDCEALSYRRLDLIAAAAPPASAERLREEAKARRDVELAAVRSADVVSCVTAEEAAIVRQEAPGVATVLLPGAAPARESIPGPDGRSDVLFFGGFMAGSGSPNEDAVVRLHDDVMPAVWELRPSERLVILGADPTARVRALAGPRVEVVGRVPDPTPWFDRARVLVVPMAYPAGIANKLVQAMHSGLPFVTTPLGAEGLGVEPLGPVLHADGSAQIAARALDLLGDDDLWLDVHLRTLAIARERFSRAAMRDGVEEMLAELGVLPDARMP